MAISEQKMEIVIGNYFKAECNVNTSIREAFEKGFRIGVKKGPSVQPVIRCKDCKFYDGRPCGIVDYYNTANDFCSRAERGQDEINSRNKTC